MTVYEIDRRLAEISAEKKEQSYGVLIPLVEWAGDTYVLLEVRADHLRRQPGEVCFPGGKQEDGESIGQCVLRETWEEMGIPSSAIKLLRELDAMQGNGNITVHPILAQVDAGAVMNLNLNADEVKKSLLIPLDFFRENPPMRRHYHLEPCIPKDFPYKEIGHPDGYPFHSTRMDVIIWNYKDNPIWGLTARILDKIFTQVGLL